MGSEKKRKRRESEGVVEETPDRPDKAERKRLKKMARQATKGAEVNGSAHKTKDPEAEDVPEVPALVSPIATRKYRREFGHLSHSTPIFEC